MPNKKGGKKYKRNKNQVQENKTTRLKDETQSQEYAQITKCLGNCRFDVLCFDGKARMASICGKMRKRVFVNAHEIVLVSLRVWQDSKCDIIDKYNASDVQKLKQNNLIPKFIKLEEKNDDEDEVMDDNLGFVFDYSMPNDDSLSDKSSSEEESEDSDSDSDDPSKIDIDDI
jgi:translation initiation factor 1A